MAEPTPAVAATTTLTPHPGAIDLHTISLGEPIELGSTDDKPLGRRVGSHRLSDSGARRQVCD